MAQLAYTAAMLYEIVHNDGSVNFFPVDLISPDDFRDIKPSYFANENFTVCQLVQSNRKDANYFFFGLLDLHFQIKNFH